MRLVRCAHGLALAAASAVWLAQAGCEAGASLERIREQQAAGDFAGSVEPLRELLAERRDDAELSYLYGRALLLGGQPTLSVWALRRAMEDPDWLVPAGLQLGQLKLRAQSFDEVVAIAGRILEREPDNLPALLLRAQGHAHGKKAPELALADADRVLALAPEELAAFEPRIVALLQLERKQEVREALREVGRRLREQAAAASVFAWHCSTTATLQLEAGEVDAARETWGECLEAHPTDPAVVSGAMSFHDSLGEYDPALEIVQAAHEREPTSRALRSTLAQRLALMGRSAEAEALLREEARSAHPQLAAAAWLDLAKIRNQQGEHGAAAEAIEKALELLRQVDSPPPQLEFDYADTLVVAGEFGRALELAEELSVPAHRHMIRARVYQERQQPARALEEFEAGLRLWPDNPYARYYAALAAEALGDFDRAIEEYRYSVRNEPSATDARIRGARLLLAEARLQEALAMLHAGSGRGHALDLEGQLLAMRLFGAVGKLGSASTALDLFERAWPAWSGRALAELAEGVASRAGAATAAQVLARAPQADFEAPRYAAGLRAFVRFAHEAGDPAAAQSALRKALAAHPEFGGFQEIRGLDLELSGAPAEQIRAAYEQALEIQPGNAGALAGLARLAVDDDPEVAVGLFDRAATADPSDPGPALAAARALASLGRSEEAAARLDALLHVHPYESEAALARVGLDLAGGVVTAQTLERARRAVVFRGGVEALEALSQVLEQRGEAEQAAHAAARARAIREARSRREAGEAGQASQSGAGATPSE